MDRTRLIAVARGDAEPDLVIEGARVFCGFTREWLDGDVAIADGRIASVGDIEGGERVDVRGSYLVPGLIDAHVHVESSKLTPDEFARVVLAHGTTAIVCDPHEIANVLGSDGVHWFCDVCDGLPLDVWVMAPSCVPASPFESPRRPLTLGDMEAILRRRRVLGVAEMMNFPAVIAGDPHELAKLALPGAERVDGHAPGVLGRRLDAYVAAGIQSDHEAFTLREAIEKRRRGLWVLIREASNARNLVDLLPLIRDGGPERVAFCTDDREPDFLLRDGHINQMLRVAVANGVTPEDALACATLHPALCHGLTGSGAIAPGWHADLALFPDLVDFRPSAVWKDGKLVARDGEALPFPKPEVPLWVRQTVRLAPFGLSGLRIPAEGTSARVRCIGIIPMQLVTDALEVEVPVRGGSLAADPERDIAKIAVVERHHATGRRGLGFVRGFGLRRGAFATTISHDGHNVVAVGVDDADMAIAIDRLSEIGGGLTVADGGEIIGDLPLPVAGIVTDAPAHAVVADLDRLHGLLADLGVEIEAPFMTLSFLALSVIPELKITDHGLIDVGRFEVVPLGL